MERILVITSNADDAWLLDRQGLSALGYFAVGAQTWAAGGAIAEHEALGLVLADLQPDSADLGQLAQLRGRFPELPVLAMSVDATAQTATAAFRQGAADFLVKPFTLSALADALERTRQAASQRPAGQAELVEAEKLAALELVVAGVAHELNNPLACVVGYSQLLLRDQGLPRSVRDDVERILDQSKQAAQVIQGLLSFGRNTALSRTALSMTQLVERTLDLPAASMPPTIAVERRLNIGMPTVWGDPYQLQQVILRLLGNARAAMRAGSGTLRISTYQVDDLAAFAAERAAVQPGMPRSGPAIVAEVSDTGPGIPAEQLRSIFDPLWTPQVAGSAALGLAACQSIVAQHDGALWATSALGHGTTVYAALPPRRKR